jgi:hypothetical protein
VLGRTDLPGFYPAVEQRHADVTLLASLGPVPLRQGRNPRRAPPSSAGRHHYSQAPFRRHCRSVTSGLTNLHGRVDDVSGTVPRRLATCGARRCRPPSRTQCLDAGEFADRVVTTEPGPPDVLHTERVWRRRSSANHWAELCDLSIFDGLAYLGSKSD